MVPPDSGWSAPRTIREARGSGGQLQRLAYKLDMTFTRVGAKITIRRP